MLNNFAGVVFFCLFYFRLSIVGALFFLNLKGVPLAETTSTRSKTTPWSMMKQGSSWSDDIDVDLAESANAVSTPKAKSKQVQQ